MMTSVNGGERERERERASIEGKREIVSSLVKWMKWEG